MAALQPPAHNHFHPASAVIIVQLTLHHMVAKIYDGSEGSGVRCNA